LTLTYWRASLLPPKNRARDQLVAHAAQRELPV
jgi:hypothetical protein